VRQQKAIMSRADSLELLATIACATLVLCGRQDALTPLARHQEIAAGIKGARLEVIEDCGPPLHPGKARRSECGPAPLARRLAAMCRS